MKFRFVHEYRETFRVGMMCRVLEVSRSGYYAWRDRQPSKREREDRELARRSTRFIARVAKPTALLESMPSSGAKARVPAVIAWLA